MTDDQFHAIRYRTAEGAETHDDAVALANEVARLRRFLLAAASSRSQWESDPGVLIRWIDQTLDDPSLP